MKFKDKSKLFQKNFTKQIPKDLAKKIPVLESAVNAYEETEKQIETAKMNEKLSSIHSKVDEISKNIQSYTEFNQIRKKLEEKIKKHKELFRSEKDVLDALEMLFDKVWYDRHQMLKKMQKEGKKVFDPEIWKGALKAEKSVLKKYGKKELGPWSDFEWGMINGKLSALRWILKEEWDMLDT